MPNPQPWYQRTLWITGAIFVVAFALGLWLTRDGFNAWDDIEHIGQSQWLISKLGLIAPGEEPSTALKWYGPLWETVMGLFSYVFLGFLKDTNWVRHGLTFTLFPLTLWLSFVLLMRSGVSRSGSALVSAMLFGIIRLGGHAAANVKDAPLACLFWLVTLYLWVLLRDNFTQKEIVPLRRWAWIGVVSISTYLLRPPVLLHFALAWAAVIFYLIAVDRKTTPGRKWLAALIVPTAAFIFIIALYPAVREFGIGAWIDSTIRFSNYPLLIAVRTWGQVFRSDQLPWWYALSWIPVICHPLVLLGALVGIYGLIKVKNIGSALVLKCGQRVYAIPFKFWVLGITLLAWLSVMLKHPVLYDEERHILFLYPLLVGSLALGLEFLSAKVKQGLTALIIVCGLFSYAAWGRFSYVYKSLLIGDRSSARFMGDYWGLCIGATLHDLAGKVSPDSDIVILGPGGNATIELDRLNHSLLFHEPGFDRFHVKELNAARKPLVIIEDNRLNDFENLKDILEKKIGTVVSAMAMPAGEAACLAVSIPGP